MATLNIAAIDQRFEDAADRDTYEAERDALIAAASPLARHLARRVSGKGEPMEDLVQAAHVGLVKAVDRFDPSHGSRFSSFATPTILGELKRHFRDTTWSLHVPRGVKERVIRVRQTREDLSKKLGREPSHQDLARALGLTTLEISQADEAAAAYNAQGLEQPIDDDGGSAVIEVSFEESRFGVIEAWETIRPYLNELDERSRRILFLRYVKDMTQAEIGERVGCSQMHISRLITRALDRVRRAAQIAELPEEDCIVA